MKIIYAIPGLNTTKELFDFLELDAELRVLSWPAPVKGETMQSYAKQFLRQIDLTKPFYLLGVSFGGMLCIEISKLCKPAKTIIVSSAKNPGEFPRYVGLIKFLHLQFLPSEKLYIRMIPFFRRKIGIGKDFLPQFKKMLYSMPKNYYRRATNCLVNWKPEGKASNIVHIHGDKDRLLPIRYVKCDHVVHGGNHAMIVYKAKEISKLINKIISE